MTLPQIPQVADLERLLLGSVMVDARVLDVVASDLTKSDFFSPDHSHIWDTMLGLSAASKPVDYASVADALGLENKRAQGALLDLLDNVFPVTTSARSYAKRIAQVARLRRVIEAMQEGIASCFSASALRDPDSHITEAEAAVFAASQGKPDEQTAFTIQESLAEFIRQAQEMQKSGATQSGTSTGLAGLDAKLDGFRPGEMIIVAGRPGSGKSALLKVFALAHARAGLSTLIMSLEMQAQELTKRFVTELSGVDARKFGVTATMDDWRAVSRVAQEIHPMKITIDQRPAITIAGLRARCRQVKAERGLDLLIVDYLQLMTSGDKTRSREEEVAKISKALKVIAKELEIPVVALAQLNRGVETRADKRPMLSDLRESGSIEQDADVVIFIHRTDDEAELIIGKQRSGQTGSVAVKYDARRTRFYEPEPSFSGQRRDFQEPDSNWQDRDHGGRWE